MNKFTKGPWHWIESRYYGYHALLGDERTVEIIMSGGMNDGDDPITWMGEELTGADKNLIAAAPDLYEALKEMLGEYAPISKNSSAVKARAALAKAELQEVAA